MKHETETDFIPKNGGAIKLPLFKLGGMALAVAAIATLWQMIIPSKASVVQLQNDMAAVQLNEKGDHDVLISIKQEVDDMHRWSQEPNRNNSKGN